MIANISDRKDTIFLSNNNVFSLEIKFSWLKKASLLSFELHFHKILFVVSTFWNHIMFSKMKCSQIKRTIAHSIAFCGFQMLKTLNLRYFLLPQNLHNHFSTVLSKTNWNTISCKYYFCRGLTSITIPNSVTSIGNSAFQNCRGLTSVIFNAENCNDLSEGWPSNNLTSFTIGDKVQRIPAKLCYGLSKLTSITIPNSVTSIGESAFSGCRGLTSVIFNA